MNFVALGKYGRHPPDRRTRRRLLLHQRPRVFHIPAMLPIGAVPLVGGNGEAGVVGDGAGDEVALLYRSRANVYRGDDLVFVIHQGRHLRQRLPQNTGRAHL